MSKRQTLRVIVPKLPKPPNAAEFTERHSSRVVTQSPPISSTAARPATRTQSVPAPRHSRNSHRRMHSSPSGRRRQSSSRPNGREMAQVPHPQIVVSSPSPSRAPSVEPALLPGGGVQPPSNFHISESDRGHYRPQSQDRLAGEPDPARMIGKMFRGLRRFPGVLVRAGRTRMGEEGYMEPDADVNRSHLTVPSAPGPSRIPIAPRSDVETYVSGAIPEDVSIFQDEQLRDYARQRMLNRDLGPSSGPGSVRSPVYMAPPPQPIPVPGSATPLASLSGVPEMSTTGVNANLEAEQMRRENEALLEAHERDRNRLYAADIVRTPPSTVRYVARRDSQEHRSGSSRGLQDRSEAVSHLPHRVYSRWAAATDPEGNRYENPPDDSEIRSASTPFSFFSRLFRHILDMPWVGERIAADFVPGGRKPALPSPLFNYSHRYDTQYPAPRSDSAFSSPYVPSDVRFPDRSVPRVKPGQSWFMTDQYDIVTLPVGVAPPPGFEPVPPTTLENAQPMPGPPADLADAYSASSHTHVDSQSYLSSPAPSRMTAPQAAGSSSYFSGGGTSFYGPFGPGPVGDGTLVERGYTIVPGLYGGRPQPMVIPAEDESESPIIPPRQTWRR